MVSQDPTRKNPTEAGSPSSRTYKRGETRGSRTRQFYRNRAMLELLRTSERCESHINGVCQSFLRCFASRVRSLGIATFRHHYRHNHVVGT